MANDGELHLPACAARPAADWLLARNPLRHARPSKHHHRTPPCWFPPAACLPQLPPHSAALGGTGWGRGAEGGGEARREKGGGGEGRGRSLLGIADREWGGRQAPREAVGRARGLMCLGWAGKWRPENFVSVCCARRGGGGLGLPDRQTDCLPAGLAGGRCQLGTRCGLRCAVRCPLGVSKVCRGRASCAAAAAPGLPRGSQAGGPACPGITSLCGWMDGCLLLRAGGCPGERPILAQGRSAPHPRRALPLYPPAAPGSSWCEIPKFQFSINFKCIFYFMKTKRK